MSRIIGGELGGRRLRTPAGSRTRPTSDRVREALFSRIESLRGGLTAAVVLDLYAGSGAVGFEALSRGAAHAVLVESDRRAVAVLRANVDALAVGARTRVVADRVERLLTRPAGPDLTGSAAGASDLVFADPPYDSDPGVLHAALDAALHGGWVARGALLIVERPTRGPAWEFPRGVDGAGERRYGETTLWYGRRAPATPAVPPTGATTTED